MSVENNNFYFEVGDLVQRVGTRDSFANKKIGVVMELGTSVKKNTPLLMKS